MGLKIKRVYERTERGDGKRILVDRLWPRGLTKARANVDLWLKDVAPTTNLRKWYGHNPAKWPEFKRRYRAELKKNAAQLSRLKKEVNKGQVTLLFGAKDTEHNEAAVLQRLLKPRAEHERRKS